jgi:hypothetical protein
VNGWEQNYWNHVNMLHAEPVNTPRYQQIMAATQQAYADWQANLTPETPEATPTPTAASGGGGGPSGPSGPTTYQRNAVAAIQGMFAQYGLSALSGLVERYVLEGYNADAIEMLVRQTPEFKSRFPAMDALAARGRAISVNEYLGYERAAAAIEQRYGYPKGFVTEQVTTALSNEQSIDELNNRAAIAAADSLYAPQDLRDEIARRFSIDPDSALKAYYFDPTVSLPMLERQSAAARLGVWATRQGVDATTEFALSLADRGISEEQAQAGFGQVARQVSLTTGRGDVATGQQTQQAAFGDTAASEEVLRAQRARVGRFQQGGQFTGNQRGAAAIGSSTT